MTRSSFLTVVGVCVFIFAAYVDPAAAEPGGSQAREDRLNGTVDARGMQVYPGYNFLPDYSPETGYKLEKYGAPSGGPGPSGREASAQHSPSPNSESPRGPKQSNK